MYVEDLLAYQYEADTHCIDCTDKRFSTTGPLSPFRLDIFNQVDKEGNFVHALYGIDEWYELDDWVVEENPIQYLACGTCHAIIDTYEHREIEGAQG